MSFASEPESLLLTGTSASNLAYTNITNGSVVVTSQHPWGTQGWFGYYISPFVTYVEGVDYQVDYTLGNIRRLPGSAIPDYSTYTPGNTNGFHMVWATYQAAGSPYTPSLDGLLPRFANLCSTGQPVSICLLGDSITTGAEAENVGLSGMFSYTVDTVPVTKQNGHEYTNRWARSIVERYNNTVTVSMQAQWATTSDVIGNNATIAGKVTKAYDLIIVAFGMNDGMSNAAFQANYQNLVNYIRPLYPNTEFIFVSGCRDSGNNTKFNGYRTAMQNVANSTTGIYVADVTTRWDAYVARKGTSCLFKNNSNHPSSFGHYIYTEALDPVLSPGIIVGKSLTQPYTVAPANSVQYITKRTLTPLAAQATFPTRRTLTAPAPTVVGRSLVMPYSIASGTTSVVGRSLTTPYQINSVTAPAALPTITIAPNTELISWGANGIRNVNFTWQSSGVFDNYKIKVVNASTDNHTSGTALLNANGSTNISGSAGNYPGATPIATTINGADIKVASSFDGTKTIKIFVQDQNGNWST